VTVSTKIVSDDEDDEDDDDEVREAKAIKRKRKEEEESAPPEPEKEDTDDEDNRLRPVGYDKVTIEDTTPVEPAVFKRVNTKQRNIRKK